MATTFETQKETTPAGVESAASTFCWYELHTPDAAAAEAFYQPVLGWATRDAGMPDRKYVLVSAGDVPVGGLLEKPARAFELGDKPAWVGYIGVGDLGESCERLQKAGGTVHRAAEDIPGVGRFAVVGDPQGAVFVLFQPADGVTPPERPGNCTPGMPVWHELAAPDSDSNFQFYAGLFGWTKVSELDMGPGGMYQMFAAGAGPIGGMMSLMNGAQKSAWLFYFHVPEIAAAMDSVEQHGGKVVYGPAPVPGGALIAHCLDTQGALFGIVGPAS
ncbi:MAG: VOC family protein [Acidobacteriaceae bacterium]|nr:VOC family protein [Acidobacteriaceae bacterium]